METFRCGNCGAPSVRGAAHRCPAPGLVELSRAARAVVAACAAAGGRPLVVGGTVRDALIRRTAGRAVVAEDVDVEVFGATVPALTAALARIGRVDRVGRVFSVLKVTVDGESFDVSTAEVSEVAAFARRDFTINALGWDPATGELVDVFGGSADLADRVLRHTGDSFADDPLRVLRGVQFAGRFEMDLAPETALVCRNLVPAFADRPTDRVWGEFAKIALLAPTPSRSLLALHRTGWEQHFPELVAVRGVPQDPRWHPEGTVEVHLGLAADAAAAAATEAGLTGDDRIVVVLGALLHDLGKATHTVVPTDGSARITAHGHAEAGVAPTMSFLRRIGAPHRLIVQIATVVREHMAATSVGPDGPTPAAVRRLLRSLAGPHGQGPSLALWAAVVDADHAGRGPTGEPSLARAWLRVADDLRHPDRPEAGLLTGDHLIAAGLAPGPQFRTLLRAAADAQDDGAFDDEAGALGWLRDVALGEPDADLVRNVTGLAPAVVADVDAALDGVAAEHGVRITWAIESGSRAWGFPSPDSDYDCRFLYVRPRVEYVDPWPARDVIELPIDGLLDVNGWDLVKAVRLAVKGNATVVEWLRSPLVYRGDGGFRDELLALCGRVVDRGAVGRHYLHVGRQQWARSGAGGDAAGSSAVALKKVFYGLRPAACLAWMAEHDSPIPPMNLGELLDQITVGTDLRTAVGELVAAKRVTRELGAGTVPAVIGTWVGEQFAAAADRYETAPRPSQDLRRVAADGFRAILDRWAPD